MADVFLMGTVGDSRWRDPFKAACRAAGITCFDPRVSVWTEEAGRREAEALQQARIVVMAITPETASIASLAESGWAALSALKRKQAFGLYVDPAVNDLDEPPPDHREHALEPQPNDNLEEASSRARKLVINHVTELAREFPDLNLFIARSLDELQAWMIATARTFIAR